MRRGQDVLRFLWKLRPGRACGTDRQRKPGLVLLQNADDLVFGEPAALHLWSLRLGQSLAQTGLGGVATSVDDLVSWPPLFTPPRKCSFVAPRGPSTELRDLLLRPDKFKAEVISTWNTRVAGRVVAKENTCWKAILSCMSKLTTSRPSLMRRLTKSSMTTARPPTGRPDLMACCRQHLRA